MSDLEFFLGDNAIDHAIYVQAFVAILAPALSNGVAAYDENKAIAAADCARRIVKLHRIAVLAR